MDTNAQFLADIPGALGAFPGLSTKVVDGQLVLVGKVELTRDGQVVDSYDIEIHPVENYPNRYPRVYEVGGRLPHNIDWHVFPQGHLCFGVELEEHLACRKGITLTTFIAEQITRYLFSQTFRYEEGYFHRERSHGDLGILEYYIETFQLPNLTKRSLKSAFEAASGREPKSDDKCFCGSGKKYKKCHRAIIRPLMKEGKDIIERDMKRFDILLK